MAAAPLLLAVDGDCLLYRAFHGIGADGECDPAGRPVAAIRGLVTFVAAAAARLRPDALLVGFDSRVDPVRKAVFPAYKGHRPPRPPDLQAQLDGAPEVLAAAGVPHARVGGYEADDVLASAAALARRQGWRSVLVTSDRDAFALIDDHTTVLRLMDDGVDGAPLLDPSAVHRHYGVTPAQYRDFAALRGDASDNLRGVRGIGAKSAARLLAAFGTVEAVYAALDHGRADDVVEVIGSVCTDELRAEGTRALVERNQRIMTMRDDLALPEASALRLPLDRARLTAGLRARGIGLNSSLWALVGADPPPWAPNGYDKAPRALPGAQHPVWASRPTMPDWEELRRRAEEAEGAEGAEDRDGERAGAAVSSPPGWQHQTRAARRRGLRPLCAGQLTLF